MDEFWNSKGIDQDTPDIRGCQISLAVRDELVNAPHEYSRLYSIKKNLTKEKYLYLGLLAAFIAGFGLLIFSVANQNYRQELGKVIGRVLGKVFLEFKILFLLTVWIILNDILRGYHWAGILRLLSAATIALWLAYFVFIDIHTNHGDILTKNMIWKMVKW